MVSKSKTNYVIALHKKKVRNEEGYFVIEGDKIVTEFLAAGIRLKTLFALPEFISSLTPELQSFAEEIEPATFDELKKLSSLKTPHNAIAVVAEFRREFNAEEIFSELGIALDFIQDPGNLGTIIRSAAWFGIKNICCSEDSVDCYNPKVIQASMGAILRVNIFYTDLRKLLEKATENNSKVYGAMIEGKSIYTQTLDNKGIILLGNESKGISKDLLHFVTDRIMIPKFGEAQPGIDSLNVSMAATVIFSEFRRS